jgi:hypothetical protein
MSTTPTPQRRPGQAKAQRARNATYKQLAERYPDVFERLLGDNREREGLPRHPDLKKKGVQGLTDEELAERIERWEAKMNGWRAERDRRNGSAQ